jgi:hypothetical protein
MGLFDEFAQNAQHGSAHDGISDNPEAIAQWSRIDKRRSLFLA